MGESNVGEFAALGKPSRVNQSFTIRAQLLRPVVSEFGPMEAALELALGALLLGTLILTPVLMVLGQLG